MLPLRSAWLPLTLAGCFSLSACSSDAMTPLEPSEDESTLQELQSGVQLQMLPDNSTMQIRASWNRGSEWASGSSELSLSAGTLRMSADDQGVVRVDEFNLALEDVVIESDLLNSSIHLTDVVLAQEGERLCDVSDWTSDQQSCAAWLSTTLTLSWSLQIDDVVVPLGAQQLDEIALELHVADTGNGIEASLRASDQGPLWSWANIIELEDLELHLVADQVGPVE